MLFFSAWFSRSGLIFGLKENCPVWSGFTSPVRLTNRQGRRFRCFRSNRCFVQFLKLVSPMHSIIAPLMCCLLLHRGDGPFICQRSMWSFKMLLSVGEFFMCYIDQSNSMPWLPHVHATSLSIQVIHHLHASFTSLLTVSLCTCLCRCPIQLWIIMQNDCHKPPISWMFPINKMSCVQQDELCT
jgi:hypothetical protein